MKQVFQIINGKKILVDDVVECKVGPNGHIWQYAKDDAGNYIIRGDVILCRLIKGHFVVIENSSEQDVLEERRRQRERFTTDDRYTQNELVDAAIAYAVCEATHPNLSINRLASLDLSKLFWPFDQPLFKPRSKRDNLVRAAALLIAEIDRMDK